MTKSLSKLLLLLFISTALFSQEKKILFHKPPIFPGCGIVLRKEIKKLCFMEKLNKHIRTNFQYPQIAIDSSYQGRVFVQFLINKSGNIENIKVKGPYPVLEEEAVRIISKLPKMIPAKDKKGKPVETPLSVPITFRLK